MAKKGIERQRFSKSFSCASILGLVDMFVVRVGLNRSRSFLSCAVCRHFVKTHFWAHESPKTNISTNISNSIYFTITIQLFQCYNVCEQAPIVGQVFRYFNVLEHKNDFVTKSLSFICRASVIKTIYCVFLVVYLLTNDKK